MDENGKKDLEKVQKKSKKPFLFRLVWRFTLFFFLQLTLLLLFYISGNYQRFLDITQRFIMFLCSALSLVLIQLALTGLILSIGTFIAKRKAFYWLYFTAYLIILIIVPVIFSALRIITVLSKGI